jgi:hypothetical protein
MSLQLVFLFLVLNKEELLEQQEDDKKKTKKSEYGYNKKDMYLF